MKLGPNQLKWIKALRSGKYKQTEGSLGEETEDNGNSYCCLGVACEIAGYKPLKIENRFYYDKTTRDDEESLLPQKAVKKYGFYNNEGGIKEEYLSISIDSVGTLSLAGLNDGGWTFDEIADLVERNPRAVFQEPR